MKFFSKYFCLGFFVFCLFNQVNGMEEQPIRDPKQLSGFLITCARKGISKDPSYLDFISRIKEWSVQLVETDGAINTKEQREKFEALCDKLNYFLGWARIFWVHPFVSSLVVESLGEEGPFIEFVNSKCEAQEFLAGDCVVKCKELAQFFGDLEYSLSPHNVVLK